MCNRAVPRPRPASQSGDLRCSPVGDEEIKDARELARKIASVAPGKQLTMNVKRDGRSRPSR